MVSTDDLSAGSDESSTTREIQRVRERLLLIRRNMDSDLDGEGSSSDSSSSSSSSSPSSSTRASRDDDKQGALKDTTNTSAPKPVYSRESASNKLPRISNPTKSTIPRFESGDATHATLNEGHRHVRNPYAKTKHPTTNTIASPVGASATTTSDKVASISIPNVPPNRHQPNQPAERAASIGNHQDSGCHCAENEATTRATATGRRPSEGSTSNKPLLAPSAMLPGSPRPELGKETTNFASKVNYYDGEYGYNINHAENPAFQQSAGISASRSDAPSEQKRSSEEQSDGSSDDSSSASSSSSDTSSCSSDSSESRDITAASVPQDHADRTRSEIATKKPIPPTVTTSTRSHNQAPAIPLSNPYKKVATKGSSQSDAKKPEGIAQSPQVLNSGGLKTMSTQTRPSEDIVQGEDDFFPFFDDECEPSPIDEAPSADQATISSRYFQPNSQVEHSRAIATSLDINSAKGRSDGFTTTKQGSKHRPIPKDHQGDNIRPHSEVESPTKSSLKAPSDPGASFSSHDLGLQVEVLPEVNPAPHALPTHINKKPPVVHCFSFRNRPPEARKKIPIPVLFTWPANLMWKSKFHAFNAFQSEMANQLCHSDDNIVVSAPTGAGKTTVFEMAIARFVTTDCRSNLRNENRNPPQLSKHRKIVYIAPSKALCEERYEDWKRRFSQMDMKIEVAMITGEVEGGQSFHDFASAHFILITPEKFDGLSRRWTENFFLFASVKLFLLDEVHLLGDKSRGCCLESIVARVKSIQRVARNIRVSSDDLHTSSYADTTPQAISSCMRIVAVSATLPNIADVAGFLDANEAYSFDESYRPVPLATHVVGCGNSGKNQFMFWNSLDKRVSEQIRRYSDGKQTLIFCHTKKETEKLGQVLGGPAANPGNPPTLQNWIASGVAYHHAGLDQSARKAVEEAFETGKLRCLCATSSLAVGVNLPARLVIVKGTKTYRGGGSGYQEIDTAQMLQMVGRAGRPGLDTRGTAVILTDNQSKAHVEHLLQGFDLAESHLNSRLVEIVNTEVSQGVITSIDDAVKWLSSTFFYVRLKKDPRTYGSNDTSANSIDAHLVKVVRKSLEQLREIGAVPRDYEKAIYPLSASHIMSQHMTSYDAMKAIAMLPFDASKCQILRCLSEIEGVQYPLRRHEKKLLNECHQEVRFKISVPSSKVKIQSMSEKAFVLLQACIGQQYLNDFTLRQEMSSMTEQCSAILTAAQEFSIRGSGNGYVALHCYKLKRSLYASLWGEASGVLNQLPGLGQKYTRILSMNGITTFSDVLSSSGEAIAKACGQGASFGNELRDKVSQLLSDKLQISATLEYAEGTDAPVGVVCSVSPDTNTTNLASRSSSSGLKYILLAYTDRPGSCLFFQEEITSSGSYRFKCPQSFGKIFVHLVASMIGLDDTVELKGSGAIQPSSFTETSVETSQTASENITEAGKQSNQSQSDIRQAFKSSVKKVADPRLPRAAGEKLQPRGPKPQQVRDKATKRTTTASSDLERNDAVRSRASVTPSPKITNYTKNVNGGPKTPIVPSKTAESRQELVTPRRQDAARAHHANRPPPTAQKTPEIPRVRPPEGECRVEHRASRGYHQDRQIASVGNSASSSVGKRWRATTSWNQQRRKQQKQQGRAFNQKRDNPFCSYQHDPNDAESHLESLCWDADNSNKIIPPAEFDALFHSSTQTPRPQFAMSTRSNQKGRSNQRRRRNFSSHERVSDRDLLRLKGEEQEYAASATRHPMHTSMEQLSHHPELGHRETPEHYNYTDGAGTQHEPYSPYDQYPQPFHSLQASPMAWLPRVQVLSRSQHMPAYHDPLQDQHTAQSQVASMPRSMFLGNFLDDTADSTMGYEQGHQSLSNDMAWENEILIQSNEDPYFDAWGFNANGQAGVAVSSPTPMWPSQPAQAPMDNIRDENDRVEAETDFTDAFF